jgi:hypothetical protein
MAKSRGRTKRVSSRQQSRKGWLWVGIAAGLLVVAGSVWAFVSRGERKPAELPRTAVPAAPAPAPAPGALPPAAPSSAAGTPAKEEAMDVAKAVMVTVDLDFGPRVPTIAEALREIERRYVPDDGVGRTFAILDAYGEPTADGKLHMSMHVSSEKPGRGSLVFRRTGEVLWNGKINPSSGPLPAKNLVIFINDEKGGSFIIDGSGNPASILDARVRDKAMPVRDFWPEGAEREVTFIYSACGCPVKVMARRVGERTVRTKDLPVIFPDDPGAVITINKLMGW